MRRAALVLVFAILAALLVGARSAPEATAAQSPAAKPPDLIPDRYIVLLRGVRDVPAFADQVARQGGGDVHFVYQHAVRGFTVTLPAVAADALRRHPDVLSIEQDARVYLQDTQSPTPSWGLDRVDQRNLPLDSAYTYPAGGTPPRVYVIDTGIRASHVDFGGEVIQGYDAVDGSLPAADCNGHGTHVSGTIAGSSYGIARQVQVVAVRVLNCNGSGTWSQVIAGIDWVTANAAGQRAVANMSLGGSASTSVDTAVMNSINAGVTYAVAAGNSNANACNVSPARVAAAITVGATSSTDAEASFSNYGSCVDILAPGVSITSTWHTSDTAANTLSGTSMAAPHVAGAAALYLQANPGASPATVAGALTGNATGGVVALKTTSAASGTPNRLLYTGFLTPSTPVVPSAPVLAVQAGDAQVSLSWDAPSDGGSPITGYNVYRGTAPGTGTLLLYAGNVLSYLDTTAANGTTYYYRVSAVNGVGEGAPSNEASATPQAPTVPGAPSLTATAGKDRVDLSWSAPPSGGSAITGYRLYRGTTSGSETLLASLGDVLSYSDTAVSSGATYYYRVSAVNAVGEGAQSNEVSATPLSATAPTAPRNLTVTRPFFGGLQLNWSAPASDGGAPVEQYRIYRSLGSSGAKTLIATTSQLNYRDATTTRNRTYCYQVTAVNAAGESSRSNESCARSR